MTGWVGVYVYLLLVADPLAVIGGLVVGQGHCRLEIGRLLMEPAERWARENECSAVLPRSNVVREGAHALYERIGHSDVKTQPISGKELRLIALQARS
ncbi:MAG: GNAT family N-acetyltransferase [Anaerolineae bacterium]